MSATSSFHEVVIQFERGNSPLLKYCQDIPPQSWQQR